jgi:DNA methylase
MPSWRKLLEATQNREPVSGLTHNFYRYPARFSPSFARQMILSFTAPGDLVIDPFMGGGTTLVEAAALGRRAVGTDISSLAVFLGRTKTTPLSNANLARVKRWVECMMPRLKTHSAAVRANESWVEGGYQRNVSDRKTWPIRKTLELALSHLDDLDSETEQYFARCVLLRTGQWALDCRKNLPTAAEFRIELLHYLDEMIMGAREYAAAVARHQDGSPEVACLHRSAVGIEQDLTVRRMGTPKMILTSPPYPGVHVLYHRWQVQGRRETPAPFWIAGTLDGAGASFYTFGDRQSPKRYYEYAKDAFASVVRLASPKTLIVQMVAFSEPRWQLPAYLDVMQSVGLAECRFRELASRKDGRLWREVPNRKWYANQSGDTGSSQEVVLFHKLS